MPEAVSIVTGNQTASAIRAHAGDEGVGEQHHRQRDEAVAGIGPTTFRTGMPQ